MNDHPDYTTWAQIKGVDVTVNINIESAALTLPVSITAATATVNVDITAQTVGNLNINLAASAITLNVNLKSQTANIDINLAASAITMNVDISAQTIGNLTIDIKAQSVGVYLQPEWAAKAGDSKQLVGSHNITAAGSYVLIDYTAPGDKKFYITHMAVSSHAFSEAFTGLALAGRLYNYTDSKTEAYISGNFGAWGVFSTPLVIEASHRIQLTVYNVHSSSAAIFEATLGGYLA